MKINSNISIHWQPLSLLVVLLTAGSLLVGCSGDSSPRGDITITITYDGKPVAEGRVDVSSEQSGEGGGADLDENGIATLSNVQQGKYTVTVVPPQADAVPGASAPVAKDYPNIPEKFRRAATSPLKAEVTNDSRDLKFELKEN